MAQRKLNIDSHMDIFEEDKPQELKKECEKQVAEFTLMKAIEKIVIVLHESNLDAEELESCQDAVDYLKARCSFTDMQASNASSG